MEIFNTLTTRRSIRKYTEEEISGEIIKKIIHAGMYAPSAVNKQPWHFITFHSRETKQQITKVHPNAKLLLNAQTCILVCYDENLQHDIGYGIIDCSAATQNMLLAAHGLGLGACWIGISPCKNRITALKEIFGLPSSVVAFAVISLGYPAETKDVPERFKPERIHAEKW